MIYDDFNDNDLDTDRWLVFSDDFSGVVAEVNSRLQLTSGGAGFGGFVGSGVVSNDRFTSEAMHTISATVINDAGAASEPFFVGGLGCYIPVYVGGTFDWSDTVASIVFGGSEGFQCNVGSGYFTPAAAPNFIAGQAYFLEIEFISAAVVELRIDGVVVYNGICVYSQDYSVFCGLEAMTFDQISIYFDDITISAQRSPDEPELSGGFKLSIDDGLQISLQGQTLPADPQLGTAVIISLFTDRRAHADDVIPDGTNNRRGWLFDPLLGSRLWLLSRAKAVPETLVKGREYTREALEWLLTDGRALSLSVDTWWHQKDIMALHIQITLADGQLFNTTIPYTIES